MRMCRMLSPLSWLLVGSEKICTFKHEIKKWNDLANHPDKSCSYQHSQAVCSLRGRDATFNHFEEWINVLNLPA